MQVPDRWWNKFKNKELEMFHHDPEKEDIPFSRAALAMCENIDWNVGRIVTKVEELGLSENTVIVYFFDNGPNSWRWNGGMKGRKGSTDEGGVRSPLFSYWNGRTSVRSQKFRLDNDGKLYDMENDPGQYEDVSENFPEITIRLLQAK